MSGSGERKSEEVDIASVQRKSWILAAAAFLFALPFRSMPVMAGVILGALLAIVNFRWTRDFVGTLLAGAPRRPSKLIVLLYAAKYIFTGGVIFLSLLYGLADPFALLAGVSVIFLAICWEGLALHRKTREGVHHAA